MRARLVCNPAGEREATMTVKAILDTKGTGVVTIEATATLSSAIALLSERKIGAVVVLENERIGGILSERDIVQVIATRGADALAARVADVMTRKVATCTRNETVNSIMERMTDGKFRHVPVIENGRLAGIISIGDVVKHRIEQVEHESAVLMDYIKTA
jgi:CBS domain-containing protein